MVQKTPGRKLYRTANGKSIDLDQLIQRNELTPAVGNARVNARGDELGAGGKIIRKREEVLRDYYQSSPTVPDEDISQKKDSNVNKNVSNSAIETKFDKPINTHEDWLEDEEGNFVKKGEK